MVDTSFILKVLHAPQPRHERLRSISPNNWVYGVELLSSSDGADHVMTTSGKESMQHLGLMGECWIIGEVLNNEQSLKHITVFSLLHEVGDIMQSIPDLMKGFRIVVVE